MLLNPLLGYPYIRLHVCIYNTVKKAIYSAFMKILIVYRECTYLQLCLRKNKEKLRYFERINRIIRL